MLQRLGELGFTYEGKGVVEETLSTQAELDEAVESVIESVGSYHCNPLANE
jgi:hypothetical protein